jgi:lipoate-protein ligase B
MLCEVIRPGLVAYGKAWELQRKIAAERAAGQRPDTLILLEHPHTYTLGRSGHEENLIWSEAERAERGVELHRVDRGGDITYHGPGQLVGYPVISLQPSVISHKRSAVGGLAPGTGPRGQSAVGSEGRIPKADYIGYVRKLEDVLIRALAAFGIVSGQMPGLTGVWVQPDVASRCPHCPPAARQAPSKIAAIGVKVDVHGITQHGFALNVDPDMEYFEGIIPCGLKDHASVAMAHFFDEPPAMEKVMDEVVRQFGEVFGFEMVEREEIGN